MPAFDLNSANLFVVSGPASFSLSRPAFAQLLFSKSFSLLGTTYGGDGRTTFALPDLRDAAPNGMSYMICDQGIYPSRL